MKKITTFCLSLLVAITAFAVPARRGWQTRTQADGTTIEVQQVGDEFYHYMINREGQRVREINGMYEVVGEAPTPAYAKARHAEAKARRQRKDVGTTPNLAPRGIVILVNFSDKSMQSSSTKAKFEELCNSDNCTVNKYNNVNYGSAKKYFSDQSNGAYAPQFDVFGPFTLSRKMEYYGKDGSEEGDDQHAADAVVEACIGMNDQIDFTQYDSDGDGYVDFVYVIYAGEGQATGGPANSIWPHNWDITSAISYNYCTYTNAQRTLDGKKIDNYAISGELMDGSFGGIGTLVHEFGHVMGLPDFYDTQYGTNYNNELTPNEWDVMDGGSYNGDGHCPPNYDPWEKYFFGWVDPYNPGTEAQYLSLNANGSAEYNVIQVNSTGKKVSATTSGLAYYLENRQQSGWDKFIPAHGMVIWKVNFNATKWQNNEPNNTANNPYFTIVCSSGTKVGASNGSGNVFGGSNTSKTSWTGVSGKPVTNIKETNKVITAIYIEEPTEPQDPFDVTWMVDGVEYIKTSSTGKLVLPAENPTPCGERVFIGWCSQADYSSATTAPTLAVAGQAVEEGAVFYAIFADQSGEGGAEETTTYTFTAKDWSDATNSWTSNQDGNAYDSQKNGIQVTANTSGAKATTRKEQSKVSKIVVNYCTNATKGEGSIALTVGSQKVSWPITKSGGATLRDLEFEFNNATGTATIEVTCTTNSIYIHSVAITSGGGASYSNYNTNSGCGAQGIEETEAVKAAAFKTIREGRIVIIRGDEEYTITGERIR